MNKTNTGKVVTRFAPSPTGYMHIGGVRTALYAWAYARQNNGTFILRIEDTDQAREVEGSIQQIVDSLKWIGINWDEGVDIGGPNGPYKQTERIESYHKYAKILVEKGLAYADPYTKEQLEEFRKKAEEEKRPFLYRDHRPENPPTWDGTQPLRFKTTEIKSYTWNDLVRGELSAGPEALDDIILIKSDGIPTYNFAHIIDDLEMGVTHIFRADEFIASTPKYLAIYEALEIERPEIATLPPIMAPDGKKKLGKRDGAKDILGYRDEGYLPEAMMNFLAFIGWNPGDDREIVSPEEFVKIFKINQIQVSGGRFNEEKLRWINKAYMAKLSQEDYMSYVLKFLPNRYKNLPNHEELLTRLLPTIKDRISYFAELTVMDTAGDLEYFFFEPTYDTSLLLCEPKMRKGKEQLALKDLLPVMEKTVVLLSSVDESNWNIETIKNTVWPHAEEQGRGLVLWSLRMALSGKERSPDPFTLSYILGKRLTIERLSKAIKAIQ